MDKVPYPARSQLFTVRLWLEELGDGRREWRGKVQHALSGEACYFRDWGSLIAFLSARLAAPPAAGAGEGESPTFRGDAS